MKQTRMLRACLVFCFTFISRLHATDASDLVTELQALETADTTPASEVTIGGIYYSAKLVNVAGAAGLLPFPTAMNYPAWNLGDNVWLMDDLPTATPAARVAGARTMAMADASPPDLDDTNDDGGDYTNISYLSLPPINTNLLYLQITNVANGSVYANLNMATDTVYAVLSSTNLLSPLAGWQVATEIWPTDTNAMPFTVNANGNASLYLTAEDWTGVTTNGLPDWWLWEYFQNLNYSAGDLDSQGVNTLGYDFTNGLDPNVITFNLSVTNYYVNSSSVPVQVDLLAGTPDYYAVLVNDTNYDDAVWQSYTGTNLTVTLGSTNGSYNVWVGLRGWPTNATPTWDISFPFTLNTVSPLLTVTNPTTSIVTQPTIQVQGYASEPLASLTFDVSNATGSFTNQTGFLTGQIYDTNLLAYTTNYFDCLNAALSNGTNLIVLHATDWSGNTANVSFTLDYVPDTNPPTLNLIWPLAGTSISGSNFTLQAQVSDPTATVMASVNGTVVTGFIEQSGLAWVKDLPLNAGTNAVTLTASNLTGGVSTTNFNVIGNDVGLTIDPLTGDELNQASVTVTGTVTPGDMVIVNGTSASVDGDGNWEADNVPVNPAGTANLNVQVNDAGGNPLASQNASQPQPPLVALMSYSGQITGAGKTGDYPGSYGVVYYDNEDSSINWLYSLGGTTHFNQNSTDLEDAPVDYDMGLSPATNGNVVITPPWENAKTPYGWSDTYGGTSSGTIDINTHVMIQPSGQQTAGQTNVYLVLACASAVTDPSREGDVENFGALITGYVSGWYGDQPLPPETLQIQKQTLINTGLTNTDGSTWGATLVSGAAGQNVDVTPIATELDGANDYTFYVQATNVTLTLFANGQDLSTNTPEFCVGQATTNQAVFNPPLPTGTKVTYQWVASLDFVNLITPPATNVASTSYSLDLSVLTNSTAPIWWCTGGYKYIYCTATVQLPNGQTATVIGRGNVTVDKPQVRFVPSLAPAFVMLANGYMELGDENLQQGNMVFAAEVTSTNFPGTANWTQLNNREASYPNAGQDTDGQFWLDTSQFYNNSTNFPPTLINPKKSVPFQDAPGVSDIYGFETITDSFKTYLVFQPLSQNGSSNIWVTLGIATWGWSATESAYTLSATNVIQATYSDSDQFPTWQNIGTGRHN